MTASTNPWSDADLGAYADGQLPRDRAAIVESVLARDPDAAASVAAIRAQNALLVQATDPWLAEPIPQHLLDAARPPQRRGRAASWRPAAALAATVVIGFAVGWYARDAVLERHGVPTSFAREAAYTHVIYAADARRPVEVWASEEQNLVRWLSRRLGVQVPAPDLNGIGFALVGGRLVAGNEKPTALLMYENAERQRLTLQWRRNDPETAETAFRYSVENGVGIFYWIEKDCSYAISGNVDRDQLLAAARVAYGQLATAEAKPK
jgi:anti-sigma factor RsiW